MSLFRKLVAALARHCIRPYFVTRIKNNMWRVIEKDDLRGTWKHGVNKGLDDSVRLFDLALRLYVQKE